MTGVLAFSFCLHLLIFMHIAGICKSETLVCIELTMKDISKSFSRSIPHPRPRYKAPDVRESNTPKIMRQPLPRIQIDPVEKKMTDAVMEDFSAPEISGTSGLNIPEWKPGNQMGFESSDDYFEMVRLKIESRKQYPESAKKSHIEGRVKVRFVITRDGQVSSLEIITGARNQGLNLAALQAVADAAPFPDPPANLFKGALHVQIAILFELT